MARRGGLAPSPGRLDATRRRAVDLDEAGTVFRLDVDELDAALEPLAPLAPLPPPAPVPEPVPPLPSTLPPPPPDDDEGDDGPAGPSLPPPPRPPSDPFFDDAGLEPDDAPPPPLRRRRVTGHRRPPPRVRLEADLGTLRIVPEGRRFRVTAACGSGSTTLGVFDDLLAAEWFLADVADVQARPGVA